MAYFCKIASPYGMLTALSDDGESVCGLFLEGQKYAPELNGEFQEAGLRVFDSLRDWLKDYFAGKNLKAEFPTALKGTPFQKKVWEALCGIPYGQTVTYKDVALKVAGGEAKKLPVQAVGGAVGRNPLLIVIPCHRVIGADGSLTGFAAGTAVKKSLLDLEKGN